MVLLNRKAIEMISNAKIIIYDEYVNMNFFYNYTLNTQRFYKVIVAEHYYDRVRELNNLILELTAQYGEVVHLRGLNTYFFNETYDSIDYAQNFNIETNIIHLNPQSTRYFLN
jgi:uroporphyrin-III C-methyltransferase